MNPQLKKILDSIPKINPRMKELAEQADCTIDRMGYGEGNIEEFAELIVRECVRYINERTLDWDADLRWIFNDGSGDMAVDVDDLLNRHFGVEE
jgi:hypothetical protein